jgi:hypothetical protein
MSVTLHDVLCSIETSTMNLDQSSFEHLSIGLAELQVMSSVLVMSR